MANTTRIDLLLTANSQQFKQEMVATQHDIDATTESLKELQAQGAHFDELADHTYAASEAIFQFTHHAELAFTALDFITKKTVPAIGGLASFIGSVTSGALAIGLFVDASKKIGSALDGVKKAFLAGLEAADAFVDEIERDPFVKAAGEAQNYEAQLTALTGSVQVAKEELAKMYQYAANTPFTVNSIVAAGIQLKSFGKDIERFLPLATALASVSGQDVPSAATALGEALSGIGGGLTRLSQTFRLSRKELKAFGADANAQNEILTDTVGQQEKLAAALEKGVHTKFGDIISQQINTIEGALHRYHDVTEQIKQQLGGAFRENIIEAVKSLTEMKVVVLSCLPAFTSMVGALQAITKDGLQGLKDSLPYVAKGFAVLTGAVILLNPPLLIAAGVMGAVTAGVVKLHQATQGASTIIGGFGLAMTGLAVGLAVFAAGFAAPIAGMGALVIAGGLVLITLGHIAGEATVVGAALTGAGFAAAGFGRSMIALSLSLASTFLGVGLIIAAATTALVAFYKIQKDNEEIYKNAETQANQLTNGLVRQARVIGLTTEEMRKQGVTASDLDEAIGGLQEQNLQLAQSHTKEADAQIAANQKTLAAVREKKKILAELEAKNKESVPEAIKEESRLADATIEFEKDKAKAVFATKQAEFEKLDEIYQATKTNYERLKKLKEDAENGPNAGSEENKARIAQLAAYELEAKTRYDAQARSRIDSERDALNEHLNLEKERLDRDVSFGRKSKADQIAGLNALQSEIEAKEKSGTQKYVQEKKALQQQIEDLTIASQEEIKNAVIATQEAEKGAIDDKLSKLKEASAYGLNLDKQQIEAGQLIKQKYAAEINLIKERLALTNSRQGDPALRAENEKQAGIQIQHLRAQENADLRASKAEYAGYVANQIQLNKELITSQKELLQSKLEALNFKFSKGADNQDEIKAAKNVIRQKEVDEINADAKARLLVEKNETRKKQISTDANNKISELKNKNAQEDAEFDISVNTRAAERKAKDISIAEEKLANDKLAYEAEIQSGKQKGLGAYEKELDFEKQLLAIELQKIAAEKESKLAAGDVGEESRIKLEAEQQVRKAKIESSKRIVEAKAKEKSAAADALEKEIAETKAVYDEKVKLGEAGVNSAQEEKDLIEQALLAREAALKAHLEEQLASGGVADKARAQRDTQIQINQAIRDAKKALQEVNDKYSTGDSYLDKAVAKYDKIVAALNKIRGEEDAEKEQEESGQDEDGPYKTKEGDKAKRESRKAELERQERIAKADVEKAKIKKARDDETRAEGEINAKRAEELRKEGKSREEIKNTIQAETEARRQNKKDGGPGSSSADISAVNALTPGSAQQNATGTISGGSGGSELGRIANASEAILAEIRSKGQQSPLPSAQPTKLGDKNKKDFLGSTLTDFSSKDTFSLTSIPYPGQV